MPSGALTSQRGSFASGGGGPSRNGWWATDRISTGNVFVPRIAALTVELDDPPRNLEPAPSEQEWRLRVRKNKDRSTDPLFSVDLYEAGEFIERVIEGTSVTSMSPIVLEGSWVANVLEDSSGKFVEARFTSVNTRGNTYVDIAAFEWIPTLSDSVSIELNAGWTVRTNVASDPLGIPWRVGIEVVHTPSSSVAPSDARVPGSGP